MATLAQAAVGGFANPNTTISAAAFGSNVTAGNRIVVAVRIASNMTLTSGMVTDTIGNTYTVDFQGTHASNGAVGIFSTLNASTAGNTVTFTPAVSARIAIIAREFSGLGAYGSVGAYADGTSTSPNSGSFTPAAATGVVVALITSSASVAWDGTDYDTGAVNYDRLYSAYDLAPPASPQSAAGTITSTFWACAAAWYPDSGGGGLAPGVALFHLRQQGIS